MAAMDDGAQGGTGKARGVGWRVVVSFALVVSVCAIGNLSQTALNAMLPAIMAEIGVGVDLSQWLTTGYMLVIGISVPIATFLAHRLPVRGHLIIGAALFVVGSLIDLVATGFAAMLCGRLLQAVSVGVLMPLMQNIAVMQFPEGRRATAMGIGGIAMGVMPNVGPTIGGALEFAFGWRSFFLLLLVVSAVLLVLAVVFVRGGTAVDRAARFEALSFVYSTLGFGGVLLGLSEASTFGFASAVVWIPVAIGLVFVVLFVRRQGRVEHPLIRLAIFKSPTYVHGLVAIALLFGSFLSVTLTIPLFVQQMQGGTSVDAGLVLLPATVTALIVNPLSGVLSDRFGTRPTCIVFGVFFAIGSFIWIFVDVDTPMSVLMAYQLVRSLGTSGLIGPLQTWSLSRLDMNIVPDGSSMSVLARQAAASFGTALCVFALTAFDGLGAALGIPALAFQISFGISAFLAVLCCIYIIWRVR